jgi:hypothetical protein
MRKLKAWKIGFLLMVVAVSAGCGVSQAPDYLVGKWKVFHVDRGGMIIGGPKFNGTEYTFRADGTVFGQGPNGDTLTSKYRQTKDSLTYIAIPSLAEEAYHLDSLTENRLVISAEIDGIPTVVSMTKLKK